MLLAWELRLGLVRTGRKESRRHMLGFPETDTARVALTVHVVTVITTVAVLALPTPRYGFRLANQLALPLLVVPGSSLLLAGACEWLARVRPESHH